MITDLNNTLKQLLLKRIPLDSNEVEISFECPTREWFGKVLKPTINLYLFDLRENVELRGNNWHTERGENGRIGRRKPPVFINLSYFITAWAREVGDEHLLLWRVMTTLMREPQFGDDILQGSLRDSGGPTLTATAQSDGVLRNPGEFWSALNNDLKPAVVFDATLKVDLDMFLESPLILTAIANVADREANRHTQYIAIGGTVRTRPPARGKSKDTGLAQPAAGALVSFPDLGLGTRSLDDGRFVVSGVPQGTHRVRVLLASGDVAERELVIPARSYDLEV